MCALSFLLQSSSKKGEMSFHAQNKHFTPDNNEFDDVSQKPKMEPSTTPNYGIRRIDRKRRENRQMNFRMEEKMILDRILGKGEYDPRIRPAGVYNNTGNKLNVFVVVLYTKKLNYYFFIPRKMRLFMILLST